MRPIAAAVPISGTPMSPSSSPSAPAVLRVPIGKVSHDSGTPTLSMPGMIGLKWTRAATPEKVLAAMARRVTTTYAVNMENSNPVAPVWNPMHARLTVAPCRPRRHGSADAGQLLGVGHEVYGPDYTVGHVEDERRDRL